MAVHRDSGGNPETLGICTDCGNAYSVRRRPNGDLYPVGNAGRCACGNNDFEPVRA